MASLWVLCYQALTVWGKSMGCKLHWWWQHFRECLKVSHPPWLLTFCLVNKDSDGDCTTPVQDSVYLEGLSESWGFGWPNCWDRRSRKKGDIIPGTKYRRLGSFWRLCWCYRQLFLIWKVSKRSWIVLKGVFTFTGVTLGKIKRWFYEAQTGCWKLVSFQRLLECHGLECGYLKGVCINLDETLLDVVECHGLDRSLSSSLIIGWVFQCLLVTHLTLKHR